MSTFFQYPRLVYDAMSDQSHKTSVNRKTYKTRSAPPGNNWAHQLTEECGRFASKVFDFENVTHLSSCFTVVFFKKEIGLFRRFVERKKLSRNCITEADIVRQT